MNIPAAYPRPQLRRTDWLCLNGSWQAAITPSNQMPEEWPYTIQVPYSPETPVSGMPRGPQPDETLWYRRTFVLPESWRGNRVLLQFGAVDQECTVWVNGGQAGGHRGGYTPFWMDITDFLCPDENQLIVAVRDATEATGLARGKQSSMPSGIWYTAQSGIWQTVWLEPVPPEGIASLRVQPLYDEAALEITAQPLGQGASGRVTVLDAAGRTVGTAALEPYRTARVQLERFVPWSCEKPYLYTVQVEMGGDCAESYAAFRKIEIKECGGIPRICLNGRPVFLSGLLDQGYWPAGLYIAPDEAMEQEIRRVKQLGFNLLRKHVKVEPARWYWHCDRLGMLVWQDMPNGGGPYKSAVIQALPFAGVMLKDDKYERFGRADEEGRRQFEDELDEMVEALRHFACIVVWTPFNEGWGQFDAARIADRLRREDPTRLVDHASGWHDQGAGDIASPHVYFHPYKFSPDRHGRAVVLTEFGGYALPVEDHSTGKKLFGYRKYTSAAQLTQGFKKLYRGQILPAVKKGLCGCIYTQLTDVEGEMNGLFTADRAVCKIDTASLRSINAALAASLRRKEDAQ